MRSASRSVTRACKSSRSVAISPMRRSYSRISSARASRCSRASASSFSSRRRARLQRFEPHALAGAFVLVTFVGLVEGRGEAGAFGVGFDEIGFDVAQAALRGVEAGFGFGQLARQAGGFGARFVERGLLRALFVLGHQQPLARGIDIGFERDDALVGGGSRSSSRRFSSRSVLFSPVCCARRYSSSAICARRAAISMAISALVVSSVRNRLCVVASSWRSVWHSLSEAAVFFSSSATSLRSLP